MAAHRVAGSEDRRAKPRRPVRAASPDRGFPHDEVGHAIEQVVLAAYVRVQRHGLHAELLAEPTHADRVDPFSVCERDSRAKDALPRQGRTCPSWSLRSLNRDLHLAI